MKREEIEREGRGASLVWTGGESQGRSGGSRRIALDCVALRTHLVQYLSMHQIQAPYNFIPTTTPIIIICILPLNTPTLHSTLSQSIHNPIAAPKSLFPSSSPNRRMLGGSVFIYFLCPLWVSSIFEMSPTDWDDSNDRRLLRRLLTLHPIQISVADWE